MSGTCGLNRIFLYNAETVTLGRNRDCDMIIRCLPSDQGGENDRRSGKIGRQHCLIELTDKGPRVIESGEAKNGLEINGRLTGREGNILRSESNQMILANLFEMSLRLYPSCSDAVLWQDYEQALEAGGDLLWQAAGRAGVSSLALERKTTLGEDDPAGTESYLIVYRRILIGSEAGCALRIEQDGILPVHAALVTARGCFYLEALSREGSVEVNGYKLNPAELMPLAAGDRIRVGDREMVYNLAYQMYMEPKKDQKANQTQ